MQAVQGFMMMFNVSVLAVALAFSLGMEAPVKGAKDVPPAKTPVRIYDGAASA